MLGFKQPREFGGSLNRTVSVELFSILNLSVFQLQSLTIPLFPLCTEWKGVSFRVDFLQKLKALRLPAVRHSEGARQFA